MASRLATSIGPTWGLLALSQAKALSQPAFPLAASSIPLGWLLSWLLIAQGPQQFCCGPCRPRLVGVEVAQAGDPSPGFRMAAAFPDHPRYGSPPAGDLHLLPGFPRIKQGEEPGLGLRQIDGAHDQMTP